MLRACSVNNEGAKSEQDIRSVSRAEAELKTRVEETSSSFRESTMRDPRRGRGGRQGARGEPPPQPPPLKAGETLPEEDDMTAAAAAMAKAVVSLDALKTGDALSPEMDALNRLLRAQAAVKKREVTQQQAGSGNGSRRRIPTNASKTAACPLFATAAHSVQPVAISTTSNVRR